MKKMPKMPKMKKAEMISAAEKMYIECYKEFLWSKNNLSSDSPLIDRYRTRWAGLYDMIKALGIDPADVAVKHYDELFAV